MRLGTSNGASRLPVRLIDGHCHLADPRWSDPALGAGLEAALSEARARGIDRFIQGGVGPDDWERQRELARRYPGEVYCTFGIHPWWVISHSDTELEKAFSRLEGEFLTSTAGAVGVGELGLDLSERALAGSAGQATPHQASNDIVRQLKWMERQLDLAEARGLPVILHIVRAHEQALKLLESRPSPARGGLVHSFSGSPSDAKRYQALGLTLSISSGVARKGFERLKKAVVQVPLETLVIESDAPDQPPPRLAGGLNRPAAIWDVAEAVGSLRGVSAEAILENSRDRLEKIFGI